MAFKVYSGANIAKTYLGGNRTSNNGDFTPLPPIVNPGLLFSLKYWLDPVVNTVATNGSDQVTSISNSGALGGGFSFYPGTSTFDPATKANFVGGTGNTKYYRFAGGQSDSMYTAWRSLKNDGITANTIISISRIVTTGYGQWSVSWTSDPAVSTGFVPGVRHPKNRNDNTLDMTIQSSGGSDVITPDSSLGSYTVGASNYTMFAATCTDGDWVNETDSIKFQTKINNQTSTSQSNPYAYTSYYPTFVIHQAGDLDPGNDVGTDEYAAVMVFDEVLDEETISGIYRYYSETRGYSIE